MSPTTITGVRLPFIRSVRMNRKAAASAVRRIVEMADPRLVACFLYVASSGLKPTLLEHLGRSLRLEVADINMDSLVILARPDGEVQDRTREAMDAHADGGGGISPELLRTNFFGKSSIHSACPSIRPFLTMPAQTMRVPSMSKGTSRS